MKLSDNEKNTLELLSIISKIPQNQIREVFISLLYLLNAEILRGSNQISIPFFGDFKITFEKIQAKGNSFDILDQTYVKLNSIIKSVLLDITENRETVVQKHIKKDIHEFLAESLGLTGDDN